MAKTLKLILYLSSQNSLQVTGMACQFGYNGPSVTVGNTYGQDVCSDTGC